MQIHSSVAALLAMTILMPHTRLWGQFRTSPRSAIVDRVPPPGTPLSATTLIDWYNANAESADLKYKDRLITFPGVVSQVAKDALGKPYAILKSDNPSEARRIECSFKAGENLEAIQPESRLRVRGVCKGMAGKNVRVEDCIDITAIRKDADGRRIVQQDVTVQGFLQFVSGFGNEKAMESFKGTYVEVTMPAVPPSGLRNPSGGRYARPIQSTENATAIVTLTPGAGGDTVHPIRFEFPKGFTLPTELTKIVAIRGVFKGEFWRDRRPPAKGQDPYYLFTDCCWVERGAAKTIQGLRIKPRPNYW